MWLADYICSFLNGGGQAVYFFHYMPEPIGRGINNSHGTFAMFSADRDYKILQPLSQYFSSQLINLEWVQPGNGEHHLFDAVSDISDGAGHKLVTAYAVHRPDGEWSLLIINKDQENAHSVKISFDDVVQAGAGYFSGPVTVKTFGKAQYQWHPGTLTADPDGPIATATITGDANSAVELPASSIVVLRGNVSWPAATGNKTRR